MASKDRTVSSFDRAVTTLAAHQPQYLPYPGLIAKIDAADVFVVRDTLQFCRGEWQNRNRIRTPAGWRWLTVPVRRSLIGSIREIASANDVWATSHARILRAHYGRTPHWTKLKPIVDRTLARASGTLADIAFDTLLAILDTLDVRTPVLLESNILPDWPRDDTKRDLGLVKLCRALGCSSYLSGSGAPKYMNMSIWRNVEIALSFCSFKSTPYPQPYPGWVPDLSTVDMLACDQEPLQRIRAGRELTKFEDSKYFLAES